MPRIALTVVLLLCASLMIGAGDAPVARDPKAPPPQRFSVVEAGREHTCALDADGDTWCWGANGFGQLGRGTPNATPNPVPAPVDITPLGDGVRLVALTGGAFHSCGLASDGSVWCWGRNNSGQLGSPTSSGTETAVATPVRVTMTPLPEGVSFTAVDAGEFHTCATASDGSAWCWGNNGFGQLGSTAGSGANGPMPTPVRVDTTPLPAGASFTSLAVGGYHTCGRASGGLVWCWGGNYRNQLGHPSNAGELEPNPRPLPVTRASGDGVVVTEMSAGLHHTCARTEDTTTTCWGDNQLGQLGDGTGQSTRLPVAVDMTSMPPGVRFTSLAAQSQHTCGITSDGGAWCWGVNRFGQLGSAATTATFAISPVRVDTSALGSRASFVSLATGGDHTCGRAGNGSLWCWGDNFKGQLGTPSNSGTANPTRSPVPVDAAPLGTGVRFTALASGGLHNCALTSDGTAWCWGLNSFGQLGVPASREPNQTPLAVDASPLGPGVHFVSLTGGFFHTCGLASDGTSWCWGLNLGGQLGSTAGFQTYDPVAQPAAVDTSALGEGGRFTSLTAGREHTCALAADGTAWCWGTNREGQLGDGSTTDSASPVRVDTSALGEGVRFAALFAGERHTCGLTTRDITWCWGQNVFGQLGSRTHSGTNTPTKVPTPVDVTTIGQGRRFTTISTRGAHTCGRTNDGTSWCWGHNSAGQLGIPTNTGANPSPTEVDTSPLGTASGFTSLTGSYQHSCGLAADGHAWCWGHNVFGELGNPSMRTDNPTPAPVDMRPLGPGIRFTELTAGQDHTCGLAVDRSAWCWGSDFSGKLGDGPASAKQPAPRPVDVGVAVVVPDAQGYPGQEVTLTATATGVGPASFQWYDGATVTPSARIDGADEVTYTHTLTAEDLIAGSRQFTVSVVNVFSRSATATAEVRVSVEPTDPVVDAGGPYTGTVGTPLSLSGSANDSDGGDSDDFTWTWTIDDPAGTTLTGPRPSYTPRTSGAIDVTLTVTDEDTPAGRGSDTTVVNATLPPADPVVDAGGPYTGTVGTPLSLSGSASDSDGGESGDFTWTWTFDDAAGTTLTGPRPSYTPRTSGAIDVTLTVTDEDTPAGQGTDTTVVNVDPVPPADPDPAPPAPGPGPQPDPDPDPDPALDPAADDDRCPAEVADDPIEAAADIACLRYPDTAEGGFTQSAARPAHVVLARVDVFADALAGAPLQADGPLLYTTGDQLHPTAAAAIDRLMPAGGTVYLLGGTTALSEPVAQALRDAGHSPIRLAGPTRIHTALAIAEHLTTTLGDPAEVLLVRADGPPDDPTAGWADSITAGGPAAHLRTPILLTPTDTLHPDVASWLDLHPSTTRTTIGGTAAISEDTRTAAGSPRRIGGPTRYATATAIAEQLWTDPAEGRLIVNGSRTHAWTHALATAGLAADTAQPILLVDLDQLPPETATHLCNDGSPRPAHVIGSTNLVSPTVRTQVDDPC